ncbi:MAG TPA: class I SAM-dependent methyltransferase [Candidatus Dormibacteraeota bacterium]|nr:class I SAM-dependent methyltransferase [Candidatus Dormibacteraeota bacterium]
MSRGRPAPEGDRYLFPREPRELDRLDVQHYALREALGANYLAPLRHPASILDVGSGTGRWACDLCGEFPGALVVGFDLVPGRGDRPVNYRFVRGNVLHGLPFLEGSFDFVHQRLLAASGIPLTSWSGVVGELVRVTRPGGWVELVEVDPWLEPAGPAGRQLFELAWKLGRSRGIDMAGTIFRSLDLHLRRAGLMDVARHEVRIPIGEWGGRIGSLMGSNLRALFAGLCAPFQERFGLAPAECCQLLTAMQREWEELHSAGPFAVAYGRRPD